MQAVPFPARQTRSHYRHELRTLTYVTLDQGNGGIIRNLTNDGAGVQAVGAMRPQQRVRLRFELRYPRLRVETYGDVTWASSSGQCGIRFVDLPDRTRHQINEWIFSNLLESVSRDESPSGSMFGAARQILGGREEDGLVLSAQTRPVIALHPGAADGSLRAAGQSSDLERSRYELDWLSRPLSGGTLARLVDSLAVVAALLLFALIFLSIAQELPRWPLTVGIAVGAGAFVTAAYWFVFSQFGKETLGMQLARWAGADAGENEEDESSRFR